MKQTSTIQCDMDFDRPGKRISSFDLTHSDNAHSFSVIPVPLAVIVGSPGSTLLLTAGTHGDEYEGQVILRQLIHSLQPDDLTGRVIILPALNLPAVRADARVSPIDQGNLNRLFPGVDKGTPSQAIAHFVTSQILPMCDAGIDLHSGGTPADYLTSTFLCTSTNRDVLDRSLAMADAFASPYTYVVKGEDHPTGFDPVAHAAGVAFISTELSGGGGVDIEATSIGRRGVENVMAHLKLVDKSPAELPETKFLNGQTGGSALTSTVTGIFEPFHPLGTSVKAGDPAGRLYPFDEVARPPTDVQFKTSGTITVKRTHARVTPGDHLYVVSPPLARNRIYEIARS